MKRSRVRSGCLPCKQRKKKCDERKRVCSGCERNQLICIWPDPSKKERPRRTKIRHRLGSPSQKKPSLQPSASHHILPTTADQILETDQQRLSSDAPPSPGPVALSSLSPLLRRILRHRSSMVLFEHFIHSSVPNLASRRGSHNPWGHVALSYAQSSELFLHACLAISSAHINNKAPEAYIDGYVHYGQAIQGLKYGLTRFVKGQSSLLPLTMTALGLLLYEGVCANISGAALRHLSGAGSLLRLWLESPGSQMIHQEIDGFLMETYFYFITMSSLSKGYHQAQEIFDEALALLRDVRFTNSSDFGHICGDLHLLLICIPRISSLSHYNMVTAGQDKEQTQLNILSEYRDINHSLTEWESLDIPGCSFSCCAEIYRPALLIYLDLSCRSTIPELYERDEALQTHFNEAMRHVDELSLNNPTTSIIGFPLAILGCYTKLPESRQKVRSRLLEQYDLDGMNNFRIIVDILEEIWSQDEGGTSGADTIQCIQRMTASVLVG